MSDFIKIPSIPIIGGGGIGGTIIKIVEVIKNLFEIFKKPAEEAGKTDQTDSLENIEHLIQIFTGFKEQVHLKATEVEKTVEGEVGYYVEELHEILNQNEDKVIKYNIRIKRIKLQINKILSKIKGTIDNEMSKKVSLDNSECKEIIKMIPGVKKETAMEDFFAKSLKYALNACCTEIHSSIEEIYDDVEKEILGTIDSIQRQVEQIQNTFSSIDEKNYEQSAKKQMIEAYYLIEVCDLVNELL